MIDNWTVVRLGDVANLLTGFPFPSATYSNDPNEPLLLRGDNIAQGRLRWDAAKRWPQQELARLDDYWLREGDVVLAMDRPWIEAGLKYASVGAADTPSLLVQRVARLRGSRRLHTRFLKYIIGSRHFTEYVLSVQTGTAVPHISGEQVKAFEFLLPSLREQIEIADILGALDDKIELNRRMNETLEAMARAIFKSWFVDFEPVRAKMERRWRRGQSLPGLPADLYDLFPDSFENSELGKIPRGWHTKTLPDTFEVNPGRSLSAGSVAPYVDMANMPARSPRPVDWVERAFTSGMRFINGDSLMARITPCLENGKTAFVDFLEDGQVGWGSTEYIVLRSKPPLPLEFSYFLARSDDFRAHAIANMSGTSGRQRVPVSCFDVYMVTVPPAAVAKPFGRFVRPVMAAIKQHDDESRTLAAIRDALLPKLISGELRVSGAEAVAKEAI